MHSHLKTVIALDWLNSRSVRTAAVLCALVLLIGGTFWSVSDRPELFANLDWRPVAVIAIFFVPVTIGLNALEFILSGRLIGLSPSMRSAIGVIIFGTAANVFPLPGSTLVRIAGLKSAGGGYGRSAEATMFVALMWIGIAFTYAGLWMSLLGPTLVAVAFLSVGAVSLVAGLVWSMRHASGLRAYLFIAAVKLALVVVEAVRVLLCLQALGMQATFAQASCLAVASVVGSAVSLVPAGLGVREGVSAALAPIIALPAAFGFLSALLNRLIEHAVNAVLVLWVITYRRGRPHGLSDIKL